MSPSTASTSIGCSLTVSRSTRPHEAYELFDQQTTGKGVFEF